MNDFIYSLKSKSNEQLKMSGVENIYDETVTTDAGKKGITERCLNKPHKVHEINTKQVQKDMNAKKAQEQQQQQPAKQNKEISLLPVPYDIFKKYAYYDELVDNIFKLKYKDNEAKYRQGINSATAKEQVFREYYKAFYLRPVVREKMPIRFKPVPRKLKEKLLQIPVQADLVINCPTEKDSNSNIKNCQEIKKQVTISGVDDFDGETVATDAGQQIMTTSNNIIIEQQQQEPSKQNKEMSVIPVSYDIFKKYAYYDELVDNIFKLKFKDNETKYRQCMNSAKAKEQVFRDYYTAFYLRPIVRDKMPIRFKPVPRKLKEKLLEIPTQADLVKNCPPEKDANSYAKTCLEKNVLDTTKATEPAITDKTQKVNETNIIQDQNDINSQKTQGQELATTSDNIIIAQQKQPLKQKMENSVLPVSYEVFKKYAYYDELVDNIFKLKYKDNETKYRQGMNSTTAKEQVFRDYYKAFYLRPIVRDKMPIRFKPVPRKLKEKLLQIPVQTDLEINSPSEKDDNTNAGTCQKIKKKVTISDNVHYETVATDAVKKDVNPLMVQIHTNTSVYILENRLIRNANTVPTTTTKPIERATIEHAKDISNNAGQTSESRNRENPNDDINYLLNKPTTVEPTKDIINNIGQTKESRYREIPNDDINYLLNKSFLNKFREKLINLFAVPVECTHFPAPFDNNEIPLEEIINDFTQQHEEITKMLLMDKELCELLSYYYYIKYHTSPSLHKKYPLKKRCDNNATTAAVDNIQQKQQHPITSKSPSSIPSHCLEKAKRIFFRATDKSHSLSYLIRTTFGLKQNIIRAMFSMTFEEFQSLTYVYEGTQLYNDTSGDLKHMFKYVFQTGQIWPTNLYITIYDLCKFLQTKDIVFTNYSTMLMYISPKFLHWSNLNICTNFEDCVSTYYQKRSGNQLNINDDVSFLKECNNYYNQCWIHEKWIGATPLVNQQFVETLMAASGDVTMLNASDLQPLEPVTNVATDLSDTIVIQDSDEMPLNSHNDSVVCTNTVIEEKNLLENIKNDATNVINNEHNYVLLPNTQEQIDLLPVEEAIQSDPLDQFDCMIHDCMIPLNDSSDDSVIVLTAIDEAPIKYETSVPLNNLLFYEDSDSNIQCTPCEQEIISLNDTIAEDEDQLMCALDIMNTPSPTERLSAVLPTSQDSYCDAHIHPGQRLPSSPDSSHSAHSSQNSTQHSNVDGQKTLTPRIQLQDVQLTSSGSTNDNPQSQEVQTEENIVEMHDDDYNNMSAVIGLQNFPNNLENPLKHIPSTLNFNDSSNEPIDQSPLQLSNLITLTPTNADNMFAEAQRLISTFGDSQTATTTALKATYNTEQYSNVTLRKPISSTPKIVTTLPEAQHFPSSFAFAAPTTVGSYPSVNTNAIKKTCARKCVATIKPLKKTNFVEQRLHPIRPLPQQSAVNTNVPRTTEIHISQELSTNCTVFNNTSLLKIVDQNCQQVSSPSTVPQRELPSSSSTSTLPSPSSAQATGKDVESNEVNTLTKSIQTATIAPIIQLGSKPPNQIIRKLCLYRDLNQFHYFKELSPQHIAKYLLDSTDVSKSYAEATIVCENLKTRLCNNFISIMFPYWSKSLQYDFLLVLNDLKEFHYTQFEWRSLQRQEDLRSRILFWFIHSAPKFSHCHLVCESNNTEFGRLETVRSNNNPSYKRAPFACLTKSVDSALLVKLKEMKRNLKIGKINIENY